MRWPSSPTGLVQRVGEQFGYDPGPPPADPEIAAAWAEGERMTTDEARSCAFSFELGIAAGCE